MGHLAHSLIPAYRGLHAQGKFPGYSIEPYVPRIAELIRSTEPTSLLDYGCGEGKQYTLRRVHDAWGGMMPTLYDPGVPRLDSRPTGQFDATISTDVLEHVPEAELDAVIADIAEYTRIWAFISVCCRPAKSNKWLPGGRNVHVTVKPKAWWVDRLVNQWPDRANLFIDFTP
jgi:hypothetical protein